MRTIETNKNAMPHRPTRAIVIATDCSRATKDAGGTSVGMATGVAVTTKMIGLSGSGDNVGDGVIVGVGMGVALSVGVGDGVEVGADVGTGVEVSAGVGNGVEVAIAFNGGVVVTDKAGRN